MHSCWRLQEKWCIRVLHETANVQMCPLYYYYISLIVNYKHWAQLFHWNIQSSDWWDLYTLWLRRSSRLSTGRVLQVYLRAKVSSARHLTPNRSDGSTGVIKCDNNICVNGRMQPVVMASTTTQTGQDDWHQLPNQNSCTQPVRVQVNCCGHSEDRKALVSKVQTGARCWVWPCKHCLGFCLCVWEVSCCLMSSLCCETKCWRQDLIGRPVSFGTESQTDFSLTPWLCTVLMR